MAALPYQAYISTRLVGLISAAPSDIDWQLSLFSSFCCFHDHGEGVSFQRSAAYQCAVDVRLREQFGCVGRINRTAVLDNDLFSDFRVSFSNVVTDEFVHCLRLRRRCRFTGTDRPYGFVSDNRAFKGCRALRFQYRVDLACAYFFCFARFVFRFGFTDAQYRRQTLFFQYGEFLAISSSDSCDKYDARSGR
ncbi:Uncharacterised protein [Salmonella enterica subsp. enterica]|uniref:Uncharacterized protein n=1 Tax=Salmonella enterica I TaxID=59201 RepID=A0A379WI40_SALET|nr:Uncharacterised protein [Salmonella enterica subsp. enterica]